METLFQDVSDLQQRKRMIADNANGEIEKNLHEELLSR